MAHPVQLQGIVVIVIVYISKKRVNPTRDCNLTSPRNRCSVRSALDGSKLESREEDNVARQIRDRNQAWPLVVSISMHAPVFSQPVTPLNFYDLSFRRRRSCEERRPSLPASRIRMGYAGRRRDDTSMPARSSKNEPRRVERRGER